MSKKKTSKNTTLENIENPVLVNESTKLDKLERERIMLTNKLKK